MDEAARRLTGPDQWLRDCGQEDADRVLLNSNLATQVRQIRLGCMKKLLGLAHIGERSCSVLFKSLREFERFLASFDCVLSDRHLRVEAAQRKVSLGDALNQSRAGRSLAPLAG